MQVFQTSKITSNKTPTSDIFFEKNEVNTEWNVFKTFPVSWDTAE